MKPPVYELARRARIAGALVDYIEQGHIPPGVDLSAATFMGQPVSFLTTAATFPGHEPDLVDRLRAILKAVCPQFGSYEVRLNQDADEDERGGHTAWEVWDWRSETVVSDWFTASDAHNECLRLAELESSLDADHG